MMIVEQKLIKAYATLVMAEVMEMKDVPKKNQREVEIEIAKRTIEILSN